MSQSGSNVPWDTAEDHVRRMVMRLDLSHEVVMDAYRLAREYDGELSATPPTVAGAAIYTAGLIHNEKTTQASVADVGDCGVQSIRRAYPDILEGEGYDFPENDIEAEEPRWSITVPTLTLAVTKRLAVPMAVAVVGTYWLVKLVPVGAFADAAEQVEFAGEPMFDAAMLTAMVVVVFIGVALSFLKPFIGRRLA